MRPGCLAEPKDVEPREGLLKEGSIVYPVWEYEKIDPGETETVWYNMTVMIGERRNGLVQVTAAAGWSAWAKEEDLVPDPWAGVPLGDY